MNRNHVLDSVRGLAALSVALGHCNLGVTGLPAWQATVFDLPHRSMTDVVARLLYVVFPSDAAVTLFFVLSGHVLWQSFDRSLERAVPRSPLVRLLLDFPDYVVGRLYRLLPTVMASCLFMALLLGVSVPVLVNNMVLIDYDLLGVTWTLQVEVVCSLALFVVHRLVGGSIRAAIGCLLAVGLAAGFFRGSNFFLFFPAFLLGALIGAVPPRFWNGSSLVAGLATLLLGSLVLSRHAPGRAAEMLGAAALIGSLGARQPAALLHPVLLFLGAISYPLYLSHPLGLALAERLVARVPLEGIAPHIAILAGLSLAMAIPLAWLLHVVVERPLMTGRPRIQFSSRAPSDRSQAAAASPIPSAVARHIRLRGSNE